MRKGDVILCALLIAGSGQRAAGSEPGDGGQQQAGGRAFDVSSLQQAAIDADPRARQQQLLMMQSALRQRNISAQRLPTLTVDGQAQVQSDVPHLTLALPGFSSPFAPPKDTYDSGVRVDERLVDKSIGAQTSLEAAQLAENEARVETTLFALRQLVNDAFFIAAAIEARIGALDATIDDLNARLRETNARVQQGTALPADTAAIEATLLQRQQDRDELAANRRAALDRLATLTGQRVGDNDRLTLPDVADTVMRARAMAAQLRERPEYEQFTRTRTRIEKQQDLAIAQERPRLSTFGRVGYGRPGLNFIGHTWETYGLAGIRVQWNAWTWGTAGREREALAIQQQVVAADEAAFAKGLDVSIVGDETNIDRLQTALATDERIVTLREQVANSTQVRLNEGVVTASEYLDRSAELLQARFARVGHQVELAQDSARLLTTLGLEVK
jgi:outer membrane protein TolC